MEIVESIEVLNKRLEDFYGKFDTGDPNFRIVWADDQFENVLSPYTDTGILLNTPIVQRKPKYGYLKHLYVLEKLLPVPELNQLELGKRVSYEPFWAFVDVSGHPVPPVWTQIKLMIDHVFEVMNSTPAPYKPEDMSEEALEEKAKAMEALLFGNESKIGDSLSHGSAVGYGTYKRNDSRFIGGPKFFK